MAHFLNSREIYIKASWCTSTPLVGPFPPTTFILKPTFIDSDLGARDTLGFFACNIFEFVLGVITHMPAALYIIPNSLLIRQWLRISYNCNSQLFLNRDP